MEKRYFENKFAEFWIEDDVLFFVYKPGVKIDLNAAKQVVEDRLNLQNGVAYAVYCDMKGIKDSDKPARDYLARQGSEMVKAVGVLVDSPVTKIMLNFYLGINKPTTPTKMFTEKSQALEYLQTFRGHTIPE